MALRFPPGFRAPSALERTGALLTTSLIWWAGGCGPGAATPMPEPPSIINLAKVGPSEEAQPVATPNVPYVALEGFANSAPPNATVSVTNLDRTDPTSSTTASPDGHFLIALPVDYGNELRFEYLLDGQRSAPADGLFLQEGTSGFQIQPSARFDCVTLEPGFVLEIAAASSQTLTITNHCAGDLTVGALSLRRNLPDFVLPTGVAQSYPSGATASLSVTYSPVSTTAVEDTLFVPLTQGGTTIRYPVTLSARP